MIYFYDKNKKYIGARELKDGEVIPNNSTIIRPNITQGKQAHFINGAWALSDIQVNELVITPNEEQLAGIELYSAIENATSLDELKTALLGGADKSGAKVKPIKGQ